MTNGEITSYTMSYMVREMGPLPLQYPDQTNPTFLTPPEGPFKHLSCLQCKKGSLISQFKMAAIWGTPKWRISVLGTYQYHWSMKCLVWELFLGNVGSLISKLALGFVVWSPGPEILSFASPPLKHFLKSWFLCKMAWNFQKCLLSGWKIPYKGLKLTFLW